MLVLFFVFWLVLNSRITVEILCIGVVLTLMIYIFARICLKYNWKMELTILKILPLALVYLLVLAFEICKSNIKVMLIVWFKRIPIEPTVVKLKVSFKTDVARAVLANSISLTPGTITAAVEGDEFYVHCLSREMIDGIENSSFVKLLRIMEGWY